MNSLNAITDRIISDARKYADGLASSSEKRADAIIKEAKERAAEQTSALLSKTSAQDELAIKRAQSANQLNERNSLLNEKIRLSDECFTLAAKKIASLPEDEYISFMLRYFSECVEDRKSEIVLNSADRERLGEKFTRRAAGIFKSKYPDSALLPTLSGDCAAIDGGFVLRCGDVETNCSVSSIVGMYKEKLETKVLSILFDD